ILISIIIPMYNASEYIERTLISIMNQTYPFFECLIYDDGSSDDSYNIAKKVIDTDSRFKIFKQLNQGLSYTRQRGFNSSSYDYICTIDADDYIEKDYLKLLIEKALNTNADIVVCGF